MTSAANDDLEWKGFILGADYIPAAELATVRNSVCYDNQPSKSKRLFLITGGSGLVGGAVAKYLASAGHHVVVTGRDTEKLTKTVKAMWFSASKASERSEERRMKDHDDKTSVSQLLVGYSADLSSEAETELLRDRILMLTRGRPPDVVLASIGSLVLSDPITRCSTEKLRTVLLEGIIPHFVLAKTFVSILRTREHSCFILLSSVLGEQCFEARMCLTSVKDAAQLGLIQSLFADTNDDAVSVCEIRIDTILVDDSLACLYSSNEDQSPVTNQSPTQQEDVEAGKMIGTSVENSINKPCSTAQTTKEHDNDSLESVNKVSYGTCSVEIIGQLVCHISSNPKSVRLRTLRVSSAASVQNIMSTNARINEN